MSTNFDRDLLMRMTDLDRRISAMERANNNKIIILGSGASKITLDGTTGKILVGDDKLVIDGSAQKITASKSGVAIDLIDGNGLISNSGVTSTSSSAVVSSSQEITTQTDTDITDMTFTITPARTVKVHITGYLTGWFANKGASPVGGHAVVKLKVNGNEAMRNIMGCKVDGAFENLAIDYYTNLALGANVIKLSLYVSGTGQYAYRMYFGALSYQIIGN